MQRIFLTHNMPRHLHTSPSMLYANLSLNLPSCRSIAIAVSEEQLALSMAGGLAFTLALNNQELMKADEMNFERLGPGAHTAGW